MATKRVLITSLLLTLASLLAAEDSPHLVQRLTWRGGEYASRYEVIIEKQENGSYQRVLQDFTGTSFFEVALPPGKYRFRVTPYDYLNRPGQESEWMPIEVRPAMQPILDDAPPEVIYGDTRYTLNIAGRHIDPNAEMYLGRQDGAIVYPTKKDVSDDGSSARLVFHEDDLTPGNYELFIKNPGGFETTKSGIRIAHPELEPEPEPEPEPKPEPEPLARQRPFDFYAGAAWIPLFPIYGDVFSRRQDGQSPVFPGVAVRAGMIFTRPNPIGIGPELSLNWHPFGTHHAMSGELNLIAKAQLPHQALSLHFRLGAGFLLLLGDKKPDSPPASAYTNTGISFQWLIVKHLYLETGLDYMHQFAEIPSGAFRPWLGIGGKF